jgi:hypothetical protein
MGDLKGWGFVTAALMLGPSRDEFMAGLKDGHAHRLSTNSPRNWMAASERFETRCYQIARRLTKRTVIEVILAALLFLYFWLR